MYSFWKFCVFALIIPSLLRADGSCYVGAEVSAEIYETVVTPGSLKGHPAFTFKWYWDSGTAYKAADIVEEGGLYYRAKTASQGSLPPSSAWERIKATDVWYRVLEQTYDASGNGHSDFNDYHWDGGVVVDEGAYERSSENWDVHFGRRISYGDADELLAKGSGFLTRYRQTDYDYGDGLEIDSESYVRVDADSGGTAHAGGYWENYWDDDGDVYGYDFDWSGGGYGQEPFSVPDYVNTVYSNYNSQSPPYVCDVTPPTFSAETVVSDTVKRVKAQTAAIQDFPQGEWDWGGSEPWVTWDWSGEEQRTTVSTLSIPDTTEAALERQQAKYPDLYQWTKYANREDGISYTENWYRESFTGQLCRVTLKITGCPGKYLVKYYLERRPIGGDSDDWVRDKQPTESRTSISEDNASGEAEIKFTIPAPYDEEVRVAGPTADWLQVYQVTRDEGGPAFGQECGTDVHSIDWKISLGFLEHGYSAGRLTMVSDSISSATYMPAALSYAAPSPSIEVVYSDPAKTILRQIKTYQGLADITLLSVGEGFKVSLYRSALIGDRDAITGLYALAPGATPGTVWTIDNPDSSGASRVRIAQTVGGTGEAYIYSRNPSTGVWQLDRGGGLSVEEVVESVSGADRTVTRTRRNGTAGAVVSKTTEVFRTFSWGEERRISEVLDPDGAALTSSWTYYDNATTDAAAYRKLKAYTRADGSWARLYYDSTTGQMTKRVMPWLDSLTGTSSDANHRVEEYGYSTATVADEDVHIESAVEKILGQEVSRRYLVKWGVPVTVGDESYEKTLSITAATVGAAWDATGNLVTETLAFSTGLRTGEPWRITKPDGTIELHSYMEDFVEHTLAHTISRGVPAIDGLSVIEGTSETEEIDLAGNRVRHERRDIASDKILESCETTETDSLGRPTRIDYTDGSFELFDYACCGLAAQTDRDGIETIYARDALKRVYLTTHAGIGTKHTLDAADRVTKVTRIGSDASEIVQSQVGYDLAGRVSWTKDALNRQTDHAYSFSPGGGVIHSATYAPDGGTTITTAHRDGRTYTVSGTAARPAKTLYGTTSAGLRWMQSISVGDSGAETEWTKTFVNLLGQTTRVEYPYPSGAADTYFYDAAGRLVRQADADAADGVQMLFAYDVLGERTVTALDLDRDAVIDYAGTDRITRTLSTYTTRGSSPDTIPVHRTTTAVWTTDTTDAHETIATVDTSLDGLHTWQTSYGQTTETATVRSPATTTTPATRTETITYPDLTQNVRVYQFGRLETETRKDSTGATVFSRDYDYDAHGRLWKTIDANGTTTTTYYADDKVFTVTTPDPDTARSGTGYDAQVTSYHYDAAGRLDDVTQSDGTHSYATYWPTGAVKRTWGSRTYPNEYAYDSQGRVKTLTTWQNFATTTGAAVTTWTYHTQRGWLSSKTYAGGAAGPSYDYWPSGRLKTRTWARGITTTYTYNNAGDLWKVTYSDSPATKNVTTLYDRLGRPKSISDAAGTLTKTYDKGLPDDESYSVLSLLSGRSITRTLQPSVSVNRPGTFTATGLGTLTYGYDDAGRIATITESSGPVATLGYKPLVGALQSVTVANGGTTRLASTRTMDKLGRVSTVDFANSGPSLLASRTYTYNGANQRTMVEHDNQRSATQPEDTQRWAYGYDALGQVNLAEKRQPNNSVLPGYAYAFDYDDIGNRETATANGRVSNYTSDLLNRYLARGTPLWTDVRGKALSQVVSGVEQVKVLVNDELATRTGEDFYLAVPVSGMTENILKIQAARPSPEEVATETRAVLVPAVPEAFVYDADGNLTQDGLWNYEWDGENRLKAQELRPAVATTAWKRMEYVHDSQGRRIQKVVKTTSTSGGSWATVSDTRFLYDGWNLVAEYSYSGGFTLLRSHVWGLDLSGSSQGAGGVGGLLWTKVATTAKTYAAGSDANGNVVLYVDCADGSVAGGRDYGAFGEAVASTGVSSTLPFGFSTKYEERESGLYYYGFRYYNPSTGRWLSRDPIAEEGGLNLYGMAGNNTVDLFDSNGLTTEWTFEAPETKVDKFVNPDDLGLTSFQHIKVSCKGENFEILVKVKVEISSLTRLRDLKFKNPEAMQLVIQKDEEDHLSDFRYWMNGPATKLMDECKCPCNEDRATKAQELLTTAFELYALHPSRFYWDRNNSGTGKKHGHAPGRESYIGGHPNQYRESIDKAYERYKEAFSNL